jgi:hypothetical protein
MFSCNHQMVNPQRPAHHEAGNDHNQQGQDQNLNNGQELHQVLAMQTQLMQTVIQMVTAMQQQQQACPPPPPPPQNWLAEFLWMSPPQFNVTRDPLEADDWLKAIEKKLLIAQCTEREKVFFVAHQLYGPVVDWWDAYFASHLDAETITWTEFKDSFHAHFILASLIELKK